jgi:crotonobetainyl-CoA:carnitine CoA-transferase CaiB-like acyl-CoA transferase
VTNEIFRFSAATAGVRPFVAALGEHGDRVLAEAGYGADEIEAFRKGGVLGGRPGDGE